MSTRTLCARSWNGFPTAGDGRSSAGRAGTRSWSGSRRGLGKSIPTIGSCRSRRSSVPFASTWRHGTTSSGRRPWPRPRPIRRRPASYAEVPATYGPGTRGYARSATIVPSRRGTKTCPTTRRIRATLEMSHRGEARPGDEWKSAHLCADTEQSQKCALSRVAVDMCCFSRGRTLRLLAATPAGRRRIGSRRCLG